MTSPRPVGHLRHLTLRAVVDVAAEVGLENVSTMVNGIPTFDQGEFTGAFPSQYIGPNMAEVVRKAAG